MMSSAFPATCKLRLNTCFIHDSPCISPAGILSSNWRASNVLNPALSILRNRPARCGSRSCTSFQYSVANCCCNMALIDLISLRIFSCPELSCPEFSFPEFSFLGMDGPGCASAIRVELTCGAVLACGARSGCGNFPGCRKAPDRCNGPECCDDPGCSGVLCWNWSGCLG